MAIGRVGSFATTQTPQVDFGEMIRFAQQKQSEYENKRLNLINQYEQEKQTLSDNLFQLDAGDMNFYHTQEISGKVLSSYQDELYKIRKEIESSKFGDNIGVLKARALELEKAGLNFQSTLDYIGSADSALATASKNGLLSEGLDVNQYRLFDLMKNGENIKDVKVNPKSGEVAVMVKDVDGEKEISLNKFAEFAKNPPLNIQREAQVSALSKNWKPDSTKIQKGFTTTEKENLATSHYSQLEDWVGQQINNPQKINDAIYQATGLRGHYSFRDLTNFLNSQGDVKLTEQEVAENVKQTLTDDMFRDISNNIKEIYSEDFDIDAFIKKQKADYDRSKDEASTTSNVINFVPTEIGYYEDIIIPSGQEGMSGQISEFAVAKSKIKESKEAVLDNPYTTESITGRRKGQTETFKNPSIKGYIDLGNGRVAVRFDYVEADQLKQTAPETREKETLDLSKLSDKERKELGVKSTKKEKTKTSGGATQTRKDIMKSTSLILSVADSQSFLSNINISEEVQQSQQTEIGIGGLNPE